MESQTHHRRRRVSPAAAPSVTSRTGTESEMASNLNSKNMEVDEEPDIDVDDMLDESTDDDEIGSPSPTRSPNASKGKRKAKKKGPKKGNKKTTSDVWLHFTRTKDNYDKATCNYCGKKMACSSSSGTSNLRKHYTISCMKYKAWVAAHGSSHSQQVLNEAGGDGSLQLCKVSESVWREATNEMLVIGELPLSFVESLAWRYFCKKVQLHQPHSRRTATRDIVGMFVRKKAEMKKVLGANKQRLSLTTDIWVAPNTASSYMVITAHFIDCNWQLKKMIIGFKNISDHKGATIAAVLLQCLEEWDIKKIFCITVDNATANSTAMRRFKEAFNLVVGADSLVLNGEYLHIRCATHIINLIVKDGLKDIDKHVAAIRNGVSYVRSSTPRLNSFQLRVQSGKNMTRGSLSLDCDTRWNSTYLMLSRAMEYRSAFEKMEAEDKLYNDHFQEKVGLQKVKRIGPPVKEDWEAVDRLTSFLEIFYEATLVLSASTSVRSHKVYNEMVSIQRSLTSLSLDPDEELQNKAEGMISKLDKYWDPFIEKPELNLMLIVASVFDPRNKMKFAQLCFDKLYGKDSLNANQMHESVMDILKKLFEEYSSNSSSVSRTSAASTSTQGSGSSSSQSKDNGLQRLGRMNLARRGRVGCEKMDSLYKEMVLETGHQESATELEFYLTENVYNPAVFEGTEFDVLSWWKVNTPKFPVLSQVAKDVLALQVSSVASESAFSTSGRILDPSRSCLTHYTIEVLMCVEQWLKCEIRMSNKGSITIEQLLLEIEEQDDIQRKADDGELDLQD